MPTNNDYYFQTHWRVPGTVGEVSDILGDAMSLPNWWPSVYLNVRQVKAGGKGNVGATYSLETRGWLPYHLFWSFRVTENRPRKGFSLEAWGDLTGTGEWHFQQDGELVDIVYDWRVRADKPLLKYGSPILKPIFRLNHRWAMERGLESLKLELERRRVRSPQALSAVAAPPEPADSAPIVTAAGVLIGLIVALSLIMAFNRSKKR